VESRVRFILVGTLAPGNVGTVCRVAKAFGFPDVRLISPRFTRDELLVRSGEGRRFAHGAEDLLENVRSHPTLAEAGAGCFRLVGTTGRRRDWSRRVLAPRELIEEITRTAPTGGIGLVLGPEDHGLTNEDLAACDEIVSIPLPGRQGATLSLPAAATILAHELASALAPTTQEPAGRGTRSKRDSRPLDTTEVGELLAEIEGTLAEIGFRPRPNAVRFRGSLRDFLARARTNEGDRLFLRYMLAQVGKWRRRLAGSIPTAAAHPTPAAHEKERPRS
jgi:TrmH family RNA methyltransferase